MSQDTGTDGGAVDWAAEFDWGAWGRVGVWRPGFCPLCQFALSYPPWAPVSPCVKWEAQMGWSVSPFQPPRAVTLVLVTVAWPQLTSEDVAVSLDLLFYTKPSASLSRNWLPKVKGKLVRSQQP